jgi:outer membrane autotransporter protein
VQGDGNGSGYNFTTGGVTLGADYRVCDHFVVGLMGGYANTGATLTQGGAVDVNGGSVGIYSTAFGNGFYLNTLASGGYNSYDTHRTALGGIAQGDTDGAEFDGLIGGGYDFHSGNWTVGPMVSARYTYVGLNGFNENGSLAPLHIESQNQDSFRTLAGFKVSSDWNIAGVKVTPMVTAGWQHEYLDSTFALDSQFANGAGNVFTVDGPKLGRDSAVVNAGVGVQWTERVGTYLFYDGELGRKNYELNSVSGGVKIGF